MGKRKSLAAVWAGEVQKAMAVAPAPTGRSREEMEAEIAAISEALKGPLHPADRRLDFVEARAAMRKRLAAVTPST